MARNQLNVSCRIAFDNSYVILSPKVGVFTGTVNHNCQNGLNCDIICYSPIFPSSPTTSWAYATSPVVVELLWLEENSNNPSRQIYYEKKESEMITWMNEMRNVRNWQLRQHFSLCCVHLSSFEFQRKLSSPYRQVTCHWATVWTVEVALKFWV